MNPQITQHPAAGNPAPRESFAQRGRGLRRLAALRAEYALAESENHADDRRTLDALASQRELAVLKILAEQLAQASATLLLRVREAEGRLVYVETQAREGHERSMRRCIRAHDRLAAARRLPLRLPRPSSEVKP